MTRKTAKSRVKADKKLDIQEPIEAPKQLNYEEVKEKIDYYWSSIEKSNGFQEYKENWDKLDYYTDLKNKLLTKTTK